MTIKRNLFYIGLLGVVAFLTLPGVAQAQFTFTTSGGAITITGYTGSSRAVSIPSKIHGVPVTGIGYYAFGSNVTSIRIPSSITWLGLLTFENCSNLKSIAVNAHNPVFSSVSGVLFNHSKTALFRYPLAKPKSSYIVPKSVTTIGNYAFDSCTKLVNITIPKNVTNIADEAFNNCTHLSSAMIGNGVTSIGDAAFYSCTSLIHLTIGTNVTTIGLYAFGSCSKLSRVTIPDSVTSFGGGAFYQCVGLTNATIGNGVTVIGGDAFSYCTNLTNVIIGKSVTNIGSLAFYNCSGLTHVTIPNSVTKIGGEAFYGCTGLTGVYFQGNAPSLGPYMLTGDNTAIVYYLPGTTGWGATFGGLRTWNPQAQNDASFGLRTNQFGFNIAGNTNLVVVVEACTDLVNSIWSPVATNTLTSGSSYFSDLQWKNYPGRFYRFRSP